MDAEQPLNYRLLYDSWLWRHVVKQIRSLSTGSKVLELLPGASPTIPVALQSACFNGTLVRLNDEMPVPLRGTSGFIHRWHAGHIEDLLQAPLRYDLILANHVIDDLLFSSYLSSSERRREIYSDPDLCKEAWSLMSQSESLSQFQMKIVTIFMELVRRMPLGSLFILRHYPSTFALKSRDLVRINLEMNTYFSIAEAAFRSTDAISYFFDFSAINAPPGSKYPNSILIMRRVAQS